MAAKSRARIAALGLLAVQLAHCRTIVPSAGSQTLFSHRVLLPDMRIAPAAIHVSGSTIESVQECTSPPARCERLIDFGEQLLTPAFINAHTHLPMAALRGIEGCAQAMSGDVVVDLYFKLEKLMSPEDVRAFTRMGAYESLLCGVGLVWEHYYHGRALADALADTGLAGVVAPTLQDLEGPGVPWLDQAFADTAEIAADAELRAKGVFAALGPHATDTVSDALWERILKTAHECGGLPVHTHVGQSIHEFHAVAQRSGGLTPMANLERLGVLRSGLPMMIVHAQFATASDFALLDPARHAVVSCPFSHALFSFPSPVPSWLEAGAAIACGTDAAASNDCMNVQKELRLLGGLASLTATYSSELSDFWHSPAAAAIAQSAAAGGDAPEAGADPGHAELATLADALFAKRQAAHGSAASRTLRQPSSLLRTVWETPGRLHPHFTAGVLEARALANIVAWDLTHPNMWPASDVLSSLVMCDAVPAISSMMVAGRWIGREPDVTDAPDFRRSLLDSAEYRHAREDADSRLAELLERADIKLVSGSGI
jgi:5-methylthioadenosine/S-adenosylhomocysteine deaminase